MKWKEKIGAGKVDPHFDGTGQLFKCMTVTGPSHQVFASGVAFTSAASTPDWGRAWGGQGECTRHKPITIEASRGSGGDTRLEAAVEVVIGGPDPHGWTSGVKRTGQKLPHVSSDLLRALGIGRGPGFLDGFRRILTSSPRAACLVWYFLRVDVDVGIDVHGGCWGNQSPRVASALTKM